jgi:3-methylfumaryl-CoA hydratase
LIQRPAKIKHVRSKTWPLAKLVNNLDRAREWLGRVDVRADIAAPSELAILFDLLDLGPAPQAGGELPPLAHSLYFRAWGRASETTESGDFLDPALPPIELPRRLCVERRIRFDRTIRVGDPIWRYAHVVDVAERAGAAGPIVTLRLRHDIADSEGVAISEDRRLIYMARGEPLPASAPLAIRGPARWSREFRADPRALFSYSALTRDKNRVHYDRPFATFVEGHPGLVVQTDLAATLLLDLLREHAPGARLLECSLYTRRWLHDTGPLRLFGRPRGADAAELWAEDAQGRLAIEAIATFESGSLNTAKPAAERSANPTGADRS